MIKKIVEMTGAQIDIEDDGRVFIASVDGTQGEKAQQIIENIVAEPVVGQIYKGTVVKVMEFGAFVEIIPVYLAPAAKTAWFISANFPTNAWQRWKMSAPKAT